MQRERRLVQPSNAALKYLPEATICQSVSGSWTDRDNTFLSQRHPDKAFPLYWECTGGSVLAGESSLEGAVREVSEELGILLDPSQGKRILQTRRDHMQDFYDVWLFHNDTPVEHLYLQENEVTGAEWVSPDKLLHLYKNQKLHPLIDYIHLLC